jgi:type III secretion protein D
MVEELKATGLPGIAVQHVILHEVRILSGLHRGAALPVGSSPITIGSASEADILLLDDGVENEHLVIEATASGFIFKSPGKGLVDVSGSNIHNLIFQDAVRVKLFNTDVWIEVCPAESAWATQPFNHTEITQEKSASPTNFFGPRRSLAIAIVSGVFVALLVFLLLIRSNTASSNRSTTSPVVAASMPLPLTEVRNGAIDIFRTAELLDRLTVRTIEDRLLIEGELDSEELERFRKSFALLDIRYGRQAKLEAVITPFSMPFHLKQIVAGPYPQVLTSGGDRLRIGDSTQGYRLISVTDQLVVFEGHRRVEIRWGIRKQEENSNDEASAGF